MARLRAIILKQTDYDPNTFTVALWADVPVARQQFYTHPASYVSAWSGATTPDNNALQTGAVAEKVTTVSVADATQAAQLQSAIAAVWQNWQTFVTTYDPWLRYGSTMDPSGVWSMVAGP